MKTQQKQRVETPGDLGVSNNTTGILDQTKTTSWTPVDRESDRKVPTQAILKSSFSVGAIIESEPLPTDVQLKR